MSLSRWLIMVAIVVMVLGLSAAPAFAYSESLTSMDPSATPSGACPVCHGIEPGETSPTVGARTVPSGWTWDTEAGLNVGSRKGPHGGYTAGTQKCQVCHVLHGGNQLQEGPLLLAETVAATCITCHDGTGGGGVYGVIAQRTGFNPGEASSTAGMGTAGGIHRIGYLDPDTNQVVMPGRVPGNATDTVTFSGADGTLTCTDCHSAHNSNTVQPFIGDRKRSSAESSASSGIATNRLLRNKPTSADTTVSVYGTGWCASCHQGSHKNGFPGYHAVQDDDSLRNYSNVIRLSGFDTSVTAGTPGSLGGSNFGYIMPDLNGSDPGYGHSELPICQQCHEDTREVGGSFGAANQFWLTTTQGYSPSLDGSTTGNPRFQNFPHESVNDRLLIETSDGLCANCHYIAP